MGGVGEEGVREEKQRPLNWLMPASGIAYKTAKSIHDQVKEIDFTRVIASISDKKSFNGVPQYVWLRPLQL